MIIVIIIIIIFIIIIIIIIIIIMIIIIIIGVYDCFQSVRTKNKLKVHKNVCNYHDFYYIEITKKGKYIVN